MGHISLQGKVAYIHIDDSLIQKHTRYSDTKNRVQWQNSHAVLGYTFLSAAIVKSVFNKN